MGYCKVVEKVECQKQASLGGLEVMAQCFF